MQRTFDIKIVAEEQNSPPTISNIPQNIIVVGENYNEEIMAYDSEEDELSYNLKESPPDMTLSKNKVLWIPTNNDIGSHNIKITVNDSANNETELAYQLTVISGDSNEDISSPIISISPPEDYDFGDVSTDNTSSQKATITISNIGNKDLSISDISLSDTTNFSLNVDEDDNFIGSTHPTLAPGNSGIFTISFTPTTTESLKLILTIKSNDSNNPNITITFLGKGVGDISDKDGRVQGDDTTQEEDAEDRENDDDGKRGCFINILLSSFYPKFL